MTFHPIVHIYIFLTTLKLHYAIITRLSPTSLSLSSVCLFWISLFDPFIFNLIRLTLELIDYLPKQAYSPSNLYWARIGAPQLNYKPGCL